MEDSLHQFGFVQEIRVPQNDIYINHADLL